MRLVRPRHNHPNRRCLAEMLEERQLLSRPWVLDTTGHKVRQDPTLKAVLNQPEDPGGGIYGPISGVTPTPTTPATTTSFDAVAFGDNATLNGGTLFIPPDPNGAAGPTQVLNIVNCVIQWYTKTGVQQNSQSLQSFFSSLSPANSLYDPKVIYDQYSGRFVIVALEQQSSHSTQTSRVLVAVSKTSDANGGFWYQAINTAVQIGRSNTWFDYPGLAISATAIYLTGNMFSFSNNTFDGSRLWILDKGLYSGGTSAVNMYDPSNAAGLSTEAFTLQPALMYGTAPANVGTYLVSSGWTSGANEEISVIRVSNPLSSPTFTNFLINVGDISSTSNPPAAPQLGSSQTIDAGDGRVYNAVWRNNHLYFANDISPNTGPDAGTTTAHWYSFYADASSVSVTDQGNVGGEDIAPNTYTYYPAVNVDSAGDLAIGFSASGPNIYAGAYYTMHQVTDPAGTVEASMTLAAGTDYYYRTFGGSANRWGDFSGMALDPADGTSFWVYNEYATTRGNPTNGQDGQWATRWGRFSLAPAAPTAVTLDATYDTGVSNSDGLTNNDNSSASKILGFTVSGTTPGETVRIYADGILIGSAAAGSGSTTDVLTNGTITLAQGARSITARQYNGIESADSPALTTTIDSIAPTQPAAPTLDPSSDSGISNSDNLTNIATPLLHTPSTDTYSRILIDGMQVSSNYYSAATFTPSPQSAGQHSYALYAVDAAGNISPLSNPLVVTYDYTTPVFPTVTINGGAIQRSMVTFLDVTFAEPVYLTGTAINVLLRSNLVIPNTLVSVTTTDNMNFHITFSGPAIIANSLADGAYNLLVTGAGVQDAAGNFLSANYTQRFFRLFGDADGDRMVTTADLTLFRASLNQPANYQPHLDYNGDGVINTTDYTQFRLRLAKPLL